MRPRIVMARFLMRIGAFLQSAPIVIMKPDDLVEFSRQTYARQHNVQSWGESELVDSGLYPEEKKLLENIALKQGNLLLLGVGGGREAIPLAKLGFKVTGVDFIPEMIDQAKQNALRHGVEIDGLVQDISRLDLKDNAYDLIWLSAAMYSCVPTQKKRIAMLKQIYSTLRPGGYFVCQFHCRSGNQESPKLEKIKKTLAWLTLGNTAYQSGDILWYDSEFLHGFKTKEELINEFKAGGFNIAYLENPEDRLRGGAVLNKEKTGGIDQDD